MTFANPTWLLLLIPLPILALAAGITWHRRGERWHGMVADRLRARLSHQRPVWIYFTTLALGLFGLAGLIVAYAQPESGEEWIETKNEGRNILLCVDISRSMLTKDVSPNRLMAARAAALDVVEQFPHDRIGLLVFSGEPQVQVPLTIDHTFVQQSLAQLNPIDLPIGGSNLTEAILTGTRVLVDTGQRSNVLVIFSDGEEFSPGLEEAAKTAADSGVFVYALGFGTKAGDFIPGDTPEQEYFYDRNNNRVQSRLNEESLTLVTKTSDGFYSRGIGPTFLRKLDNAMQEMDRFEQEGKHQRIAKPAYQWFLFTGLLLLMSSLALRCFPLRSAAAAILALLLLPTPSANANPLADGRTALRQGEAMRAHSLLTEAAEESSGDRAARIHLAAGSAAFQAQGWTSAADSFSQALVSSDDEVKQQAHYSLATSLFYLGVKQSLEAKINAWRGAIEHYEQALEIDPNDEKAATNLEAVKKFLKEIEPEEEKKEKSEEDKDDQPPKDGDQEESGDQSQDKSDEPEDNEEKSDQQNQEKSDEPKHGESENENLEEPGEGDENQENPSEKEDKGDKSENEDEGTGDGEQNDPKMDQEKPENQEDKNDQNSKSDKKSTKASEQESDQPLPTGESKEERARRLLRQHADFGGKPPQARRPAPRRPEKDW
ncbi:VWA domain-containing protein [Akkermansiaceae bacterium]|nr:VWA domain-containing protein [Akkermansiaceae bacterium]MDA7888076.1 VWA domain-containing protein [Akkermansiaceae bacterium]